MKKICKDCGEFKEHEAKGLCKTCYNRKYRFKNSKKVTAVIRKWQKANPEKVKIWAKKWRLENKDRLKKYNKKWRFENSDYNKKWRFENPNYDKKWRLENPGKCREKELKKRGYGKVKKGIIAKLINENILKYGIITCEKDKKPCSNDFHIDHIIPVSKGGSNDYSNLQILCAHCNRIKYIEIADYRQDIKNNQMFLK